MRRQGADVKAGPAHANRHDRSAGYPGRLALLLIAVLAVSLLLIFSHFSHFLATAHPAQLPLVVHPTTPIPPVRKAWNDLVAISRDGGEDKHDMCQPLASAGRCVGNSSLLADCSRSCKYFVYCEMCEAKIVPAKNCVQCNSTHARYQECTEQAGGSFEPGAPRLPRGFLPSHVDRRLKLPESSQVVVEVGGNLGGDLAWFVNKLPNATIFTFEPVPDFAAKLAEQYAGQPRVVINRFGIADRDANTTFNVDGEGGQATGGLKTKPQQQQVPVVLRDVSVVLEEVQHAAGRPADSMSINCEGCEYLVLRRMQEQGWLPRVRYLQVSWHVVDGIRDRVAQRCALEHALQETHDLLWYDGVFGWQGWQRRRSPPEATASTAQVESEAALPPQ